jgi:hypothetical protein
MGCFCIERIKKRIMDSYKIQVSEKYSTVYFPITKVACTSLRKALKEIGFESKKLKELNLRKYKHKFAFVRNPYEWLIN